MFIGIMYKNTMAVIMGGEMRKATGSVICELTFYWTLKFFLYIKVTLWLLHIIITAKLRMNVYKVQTHAVNNIITFSWKYVSDSRKLNIDRGRILATSLRLYDCVMTETFLKFYEFLWALSFNGFFFNILPIINVTTIHKIK